jgi:hypothetical protein
VTGSDGPRKMVAGKLDRIVRWYLVNLGSVTGLNGSYEMVTSK